MSPKRKPTVKKIARTVYLPEPLHQLLNATADETGVNANNLVILALRQYLMGQGTPPPAPPAAEDDDVAGFD